MHDIITEIDCHISRIGDRPGLCLHYAKEAIAILTRHGYRAVIQAGSLQWPCLCPEDDDGIVATHFAYMWDPTSPINTFSLALGNLPEMHCWVGLLDQQEIVDFSVRHLKEAAAIRGVRWTAEDPPSHLWCPVDKIPDDVRYIPDMKASIFAHMLLESL
jgi:hypothetical protein